MGRVPPPWAAAPLKRAPLPLPLLHKNGSAAPATAPQNKKESATATATFAAPFRALVYKILRLRKPDQASSTYIFISCLAESFHSAHNSVKT